LERTADYAVVPIASRVAPANLEHASSLTLGIEENRTTLTRDVPTRGNSYIARYRIGRRRDDHVAGFERRLNRGSIVRTPVAVDEVSAEARSWLDGDRVIQRRYRRDRWRRRNAGRQ
jgi:hypothetical protein